MSRRILFVGGKGGVGKTTVASALAMAAAMAGRRCLIVSTDPAHSLADIFEMPIGRGETALGERLTGLEIDPQAEADEHVASVKQGARGLVSHAMQGEVERQIDLARASPGMVEAAMMERVARLMIDGPERFDLVLFDTAPTGHTLRLLSLPEAMTAWTDGLLRHQRRAEHWQGMLERLQGAQQLGDGTPDTGIAAEDDASGKPTDRATGRNPLDKVAAKLLERRRLFHRARRELLDPERCAFLLVLNAERLPILESRRTVETLARFEVPVAALIVNRVLPEDADGAFLAERRRRERTYLDEIEHDFATMPRVRLPLMESDVRGMEALSAIARRLWT